MKPWHVVGCLLFAEGLVIVLSSFIEMVSIILQQG